ERIHGDVSVVVPLSAVGRGRGRILDTPAVDESAQGGGPAGLDLRPLSSGMGLTARRKTHGLRVVDVTEVGGCRGAVDRGGTNLSILRLDGARRRARAGPGVRIRLR